MGGKSLYSSKRTFKSKGERTIAALLDEIGIPFQYEPPVLINDNGYERRWYLDFKLPDYSVYIEYFGIEHDRHYSMRTQHKLETFQKNNIDVIPVYPAMLRGDYAGYILSEIHRTCMKRLTGLERKIYLHATQPSPESVAAQRSYSSAAGSYR